LPKKFGNTEILSTFAIPFGETSLKGQFFKRNSFEVCFFAVQGRQVRREGVTSW
jgi:hypothetical protein